MLGADEPLGRGGIGCVGKVFDVAHVKGVRAEGGEEADRAQIGDAPAVRLREEGRPLARGVGFEIVAERFGRVADAFDAAGDALEVVFHDGPGFLCVQRDRGRGEADRRFGGAHRALHDDRARGDARADAERSEVGGERKALAEEIEGIEVHGGIGQW